MPTTTTAHRRGMLAKIHIAKKGSGDARRGLSGYA